ncbi:MAG: ABC transporter permease [Blastocatellia bacterium]|nr:ABC transporter permease [Blastocatellia bacterium]
MNPNWKQIVRQHLAVLRLPPEREIEIVEELALHMEAIYEDALADGLSEAEAEARAARGYDWRLLECELSRAERPPAARALRPSLELIERKGGLRMESFIQDLRFGARMLMKQPGFTLIAVITLALGIGANTAIFSVINALLLRPLPYRQPERLVKVFQWQPDPTKGMLPSIWSYPRFEMLRDQNQSFAAVAGYKQAPYNLTGTDEPERLQVEMVSASYFPMLGVNAVVGRAFTAEEDAAPGANLSALLSHGLWRRRFGGDPQVIGKTIELDKQAFTIVGVLPPGFRGQDGTADAWVTVMAAPLLRYKTILTNPRNYWLFAIARLKDGVTLAQAQSDMRQVGAQIERKYPSPKRALTGDAEIPAVAPLQAAKVDPAIKTSFLTLLAAVGLALMIACANVANLLLARAVARRHEFALRAALGAGRLRLLRQGGAESLLLALFGGALGVMVARLGVELLTKFHPSDNAQFWSSYARAFDFFTINLDWRALGFNFALALLTGLLFGLAPALQSSFVDVNEALKEGAGGSATGFRGLSGWGPRSLLVVGEIALSLVLLISAGLMLKSLGRLQTVHLGFAPENVLTMAAPSRDAKPGFYEQLLARLQALPGVEAASIGSSAPLLGYSSQTVMDIEGRSDIQMIGVGYHSVSPDYFQTLGIALRRGRAFTPQDRAGAPRVAIINQAAAEKFFPNEDPIGKRIRPYVDPAYKTDEKFVEIVGVAPDVRYGRLEEAIEPDIYVSSLQPTDDAQTLIIRTHVDPATITAAVRREALALDRNVPLTAILTMKERAAEVTSRARFIAALLALFAGLALALSSIGIYGVMAYSVSARTREIGVRMALGAQSSAVLRLALGDGLKLIAAGMALGACAAVAAVRVLQTQLYDVRATDPPTFAAGALLLAGVGALACYIPARRATKVDPLTALRHE